MSLDDAEVRYRALFETMGPAVLLMRGPACIDCNPATVTMFGLSSREEILGRTPLDFAPELQPGGEPSARLVERNIGAAIQKGSTTFEWTSHRKDGTPFLMEVRFALCGPAQDGLFLCIAEDVTERRRQEASQRRVQRLEALGTLAGGIAHDFNNLLHSALGYVAAAKESDDAADARRLLERSEQALGLAAALTAKLLAFSRGGTPVKAVVPVAPAVAQAAALVSVGVGLRIELDPAAAAVDAEKCQLEQVLQDLLRHAATRSPPGGAVRVSTRLVESPGLAELAPGPHVAITVADEGPAIAPEHLGRVFDPYFGMAGGGIGLAAVWSIVRNHGGAVDVRSGPGAAFTVYWPAAVGLPAPAPAPARPPAQGRHILVMDDDPMIREVTGLLLASLGHVPHVVADGAQAVAVWASAMAAGRPYDLVILDLTVPGGMGGLEALRRIRAVDPAARAVVSSGYSDDSAIGHYVEHGFDGVLRKPYRSVELARVVTDLLG